VIGSEKGRKHPLPLFVGCLLEKFLGFSADGCFFLVQVELPLLLLFANGEVQRPLSV
jgi:hypothetical protein